ncbi:MAG: hypothetical protein KGR98_04120, partial [Verrucomicrobia bacterium]|nr:hypothetical protein [Verrucomicrobiota bacterium]
MLLDVGRHLSFDYTASLSYYSSPSFRDTLDHRARMAWGTAYQDWNLSLSQGYTSTSNPRVQTAVQTDRENYDTSAGASHQLNDKLSVDIGLNQDFHNVGTAGGLTNVSNARVWSTMDWLNYHFGPRFIVGAGAGFNYVSEQLGSDMASEQYQGRVNWRATDKISLQLSGGLNDQQFLSGGQGDMLTPVFTAAIEYQPFEQTRITLTGDRSVTTSYFRNQIIEGTGMTASLDQRLLGWLNLVLSGGYRHSKYLSSVAVSAFSAGTARTDDYYWFTARLGCPFLKRGSCSVFYQYSANSSTQTGFAQFYQTAVS